MKSLLEIFPRASQATIQANPQLSGGSATKSDVQGSLAPAKGKRRGRLNKVEAEFALRLEAMKLNGEIARYEFEGMTLRWSGIKYTPDFLITQYDSGANLSIKFIEVKGAYTKGKFERAIERFRHARTYYPEFTFEMWQKQKGGQWQILM